MKYFGRGITTGEMRERIGEFTYNEVDSELQKFIKESDSKKSFSLEEAERFFDIIDNFSDKELNSEQYYQLLDCIQNALKKGGTVRKVFYNSDWYRYIYLYLIVNYTLETSDYSKISFFLKEGSVFRKILEHEDSVNGFMTVYGILGVLDGIFNHCVITEIDKDGIESWARPYVQHLLISRDKVDEIDLKYLLSISTHIGVFDEGNIKRINQYVNINIEDSEYFVQEYLDFIKKLGSRAVKQSQKTLQALYEQTDSDIIKSQIIELQDSIDEVPDEEIIKESKEDIVKRIKKNIDEIRAALVINAEKLDDNKLYGHYTKIDTLVNFLFRQETEETRNNPTFLRLSHANQMNDPMEGKVLLDVLGLQAHIEKCYSPTNVFLSSLTVVKDSLPMWKEYADESKGAFLEYDKDYLKEIVAHDVIEFAKVHYIARDSEGNIVEKDEIDKKLTSIQENIGRLKVKKFLKKFLKNILMIPD